MARRQARKASARQQQTANRRPTASRGAWRYWVMLTIVVLLALVMVVTSLPAQ